MYKKAFELSYKNKKVEIEIQDFTDTVRNINGTEDLFSLSYISDSKDKGQSILVTEADINFYADDYFNIDELKTVGETDIKVKYYEDDALLWSGFVIPDFFSTSVDIAPVVSMVATDRIGTLKEISNNAESNIPIQILASCLKQTGQDLPINLIIDNNHFETPIQLERIDEIASYDVIRTFMVLFNCKITLYKNAWWIINKKLLENGFVNYKSYSSNGVGGSVTPFAQPILDIDLVDRDGQREIKPTASEISLFLEFGGSKKYPNNWNFEKLNKTAKLFDSWSNHAGFEQGWRDKRILFYVYASGYYNAWFSDEDTEKISLWYRFYWYNNKISDNILDYPNLRSEFVKVPTDTGIIEISLNGSFTTRDGNPVLIMPIIHNKTTGKYYTYNRDGEIASAGNGSLNFDLSKIDFIHNPRTSTEDGFNFDDLTHEVVDINWDIKNKFNVSDFGSDTDKLESQIIFIGGVYLQGALDLGIDIFINSVQISFNDSQITGKGLIFKIKQGGEKFSKSRETETILFSDKINQGVNGHFYNYKYDDTSIVDLPSEFALSSVRERADMFSKARDYYSLDGNFIVNPLAKYVCGLKSFVLVGGENRREDAGIIVEEIVSNTLNRTDFIYTYFDDGKDKVKSIGTASGGSSSGGGGGAVSSPQLWKVDEEGNIYTEYNAYSLKNLSAFGLGAESGGPGGGSMLMMQDWTLTTATENYYLPAKLAVPFYDDTRSRLSALEAGEGGSATTVNVSVSGTGDLLASVSKVDNNIEFIKGNQSWKNLVGKPSTFIPSAHTHPISDITNLQNTLANKLETSIFNTHNNDNIRHITGAERTKWDDAYGWGDFRDYGLGANYSILDLDDQKNNSIGFTTLDTANRTMPYGGVFRFGSNTSYVQLYGEYQSKQDLHFRRNRNGVFDDWRKLWHDGNLTSLSQLTDNIGVATHIANKANPHSVTKAQVGLGSVDNTSDLLKPISTAMQNALNTKVSKSGDTMSGALNIISEIASGSRLNIKRTGSNYNAVVSFENSSGILEIGRTTDVFVVGEGDIYSEANRWLTVSRTAVTAPKVSFGNGWTAEGVGAELQFKLNGVIQAKIVNGALVSMGEVTAFY